MAITNASVAAIQGAVGNAGTAWNMQGTTVWGGVGMGQPGPGWQTDWWRQRFGAASHALGLTAPPVRAMWGGMGPWMQTVACRSRAIQPPVNETIVNCCGFTSSITTWLYSPAPQMLRWSFLKTCGPTCADQVSVTITNVNGPTTGKWWKQSHWRGWMEVDPGIGSVGTITWREPQDFSIGDTCGIRYNYWVCGGHQVITTQYPSNNWYGQIWTIGTTGPPF